MPSTARGARGTAYLSFDGATRSRRLRCLKKREKKKEKSVRLVKRKSKGRSNVRTLGTVVNADRGHEARKLSVLWGRCVAL